MANWRDILIPSDANESDESRVAVIKQIESGGRRYGKDGNLLKSPSGALGEMQVMPSTAAKPGFGIRPSDGTPDDLARVGRDYLSAMNVKYSGDEKKIFAAYNAGPGAVDAAVKAHGENWLENMSPQAQNYITKRAKIVGTSSAPTATAKTADWRSLIDTSKADAKTTADWRSLMDAPVIKNASAPVNDEPVNDSAPVNDEPVNANPNRKIWNLTELKGEAARLGKPMDEVGKRIIADGGRLWFGY